MEVGIFKFKKLDGGFLFFSLFVFIITTSISNVYALDISCPPNTEVAGGTGQYRSSLTQDEILRFYQQKLVQEGWQQASTSSQQTTGFGSLNRTFNFVKGSDTLFLTFYPFNTEGFVFYTINTGVPLDVGDLSRTEELSLDNVDKDSESLDFMPIFSISKQVDYRETSSGTHACYMANSEVEEVEEFYLQEMPEYGWNLFNQESLGEKEYNLSEVGSTCSTCPKISLENKEVAINVKRTGVILEFKREDKVCSVTISKMENPSTSQVRGLTSLGLGDTIIMVVYENK